MGKKIVRILFTTAFFCVISSLLYGVFERGNSWWAEILRARIKYAIWKPERINFIPSQGDLHNEQQREPTLTVSPSPATEVARLSDRRKDNKTATPIIDLESSITLQPSSTALPNVQLLQQVPHIYQSWNNCGPANLTMVLRHWGWTFEQEQVATELKPNKLDKNVSPWEIKSFVEKFTDLKAVIRVGGDVALLRRFIAEGFPVLIEKGYESQTFEGWMGHYQVIIGYDDNKRWFIAHDSYKGPGQVIAYENILSTWRAFNFIFILLYPPEKEEQIFRLLGHLKDELASYRYSKEIALAETLALDGRDLYFAWNNLGTSQLMLGEFAEAAEAFDRSFEIYTTIPYESRPWRMIWYQSGPYQAYYETGRYQDVIDLATTTLKSMATPLLEESFYWRSMARLAIGEYSLALKDLRACLEAHPGFVLCSQLLENLEDAN